VAKQWSAPPLAAKTASSPDSQKDSLDIFLERVNHYSLAVSGMAFQDAWNLDVERLKDCFIHVVSPDSRIIPFCAYNLTDRQGRAIYRGKG
jgi:hypothetical protein